MDFMKVLDQTVREIKREVNKKVLKVPEIEQKVLDATSNEPWGPHGSVLAEIAQATKNFTECQIIMNVLWMRLTDTGRNWRHVYKALSVIEYLVANGAERVADDIIEHTYQISSISEFEYVEPSGKDVGINVRKKVETILVLLNDKDKIQQVRTKAAANRDKYFGLSSTGISSKSSSASYGGNGGFGRQSGERENDMFKDSYKDGDHYGDKSDWKHGKGDGYDKDGREKSQRGRTSENEGIGSKKEATGYESNTKASTRLSDSDHNGGPVPSSQSLKTALSSADDDFDDFDPRGSSTTGAATASFGQVDLFGLSLAGDLIDAPTTVPMGTTSMDNTTPTEVDLFADANFVSAFPHVEAGAASHAQAEVDLFAQQAALSAAFPSTVDFFAAPDPLLPTAETKPKSEAINLTTTDPFAPVPLNSFQGSDDFGDFTSHTVSLSTEATGSSTNEGVKNPNQNISTELKPPAKKDNFQIKSGIWADSLSRGLIDLNISAPKKTNLADIGIVGGLSDGSEEKEKGATLSYMGRAMGAGSSLGRSGITSMGIGGGSFSNQNQHHYGSFK